MFAQEKELVLKGKKTIILFTEDALIHCSKH